MNMDLYIQMTKQVKVEDCVIVPVPKVDRGPTDSSNIIAIVIE